MKNDNSEVDSRCSYDEKFLKEAINQLEMKG
jgi:hypothetical protein